MTPRDSPRTKSWRTVLPWAILAFAAIGLAWHVRMYAFVTDDAYISFRYARNWAEGHGLVFNPGDAPVEGYTNFLWVAWLALWLKLGVPPEPVAMASSVAATFILWGGVAWFGRRLLPAERRGWFVIAPLLLAANRSFCVWASGGLETRWFELFALAGLARAWIESRATAAGAGRRPWASLLLGLACLLRPDGLLLLAGTVAVCERRAGRRARWRSRVLRWWPGVLLVLGHIAWRSVYYGDLLPNTYYAKFGGSFLAAWGVPWLAWFLVEYGLWFWTPFLWWGARAWRRQAAGLGAIVAIGLVSYVAYLVYAGGDLFEFRLLDLVWVPLALLAQSGAAAAAGPVGSRRAVLAAGSILGLIVAGGWLPLLSHRAFPRAYVTSFPGGNARPDGSRDLAPPGLVPSWVRPALVPWMWAYNGLARHLTVSLVGLRQEEHARFAAEVVAAGLDLRDLVQQGILPPDTRIALNCVGAIPYLSRLWTLDRIGLCDRHVARMPRQAGSKLAHAKMADPEYIRSQRVDLEPVLPYNLFVADAVALAESRRPRCAPPRECYVAHIGPDLNVLARLPLGLAQTRRRLPALPFEILGARAPGDPVP